MNQKIEREMPKYVCHKVVHALKIKEVKYTDGGEAVLIPVDERFGPKLVNRAFVDRHDPFPMGYYVVYADGYESFSPARAFEEGYKLMEGGS